MMFSRISSPVRRGLAIAALFAASTAAGYYFHVPPARACGHIAFCIPPCYEDFQGCQAACATECGRQTPWYDIACDNACSGACYEGERQCLRDCACVF